MIDVRRVTALALRFNLASKARFILLTLVAAVAMTVFLIITELSRVSSQDLKQSISREAGHTGTYAIDAATTLGMSPEALAAATNKVLAGYSSQSLEMVEVVPQLKLDCSPGTTLGSQPVLVVRTVAGHVLDPPPGRPMPPGTRVCLGGQQIPSSVVHIPTPSEQFDWLGVAPGTPNTGVIIGGAYERMALLSTTQPVTYRFVMVTDQQYDQSQVIQQSLNTSFETAIRVNGMSPSQGPLFIVTRLDTDQAIRRAAAGVDLVYSIIAWGVLTLGALGLLVAEMIVVRDRTWFFGLSRAVGGEGSHIAALILVDILLVLVAGTTLTVGLVLALQPFAAAFAESAFQVPGVRFLQPSAIPQLIGGELVVLILAGVYPALRAVRQDPLDVLEPRVS